MSNSIRCIEVYRIGSDGWAFDDPTVGLVREPFVAGADAIISVMVSRRIAGNPKRIIIMFSDSYFPVGDLRLDWVSHDGGGNWYEWEGLRGWLCPALFKYFRAAPEHIFVDIMPVIRRSA